MKTAVRIFAFAIVVAGFAAAATSNSSHLRASHLSATSALPAPYLSPGCACGK
jgi:hypothetical protein